AGDAGGLRHRGAGGDAHGDHGVVGEDLTGGGVHGHAIGGLAHGGDAGRQSQVDASAALQRGADLAEVGTEGPLHRLLGGLEDGDIDPLRPGGRGDLGADEAGTDHDQAAGGVEGRAEVVRVVPGAEVVDAFTG